MTKQLVLLVFFSVLLIKFVSGQTVTSLTDENKDWEIEYFLGSINDKMISVSLSSEEVGLRFSNGIVRITQT